MPRKQTINFQELLDPEPCEIIRTLVDAGYEAYLVGGAVRDLLLGEKPKDYDITTSATPEQVRSVFGRRRCHVIGRRFRLALVFVHGVQYEVSTFRRTPEIPEPAEGQEKGNTLIWDDNTFGTQEEDSFRRDFTVNAIYYDVAGDRGFIDYTGGLSDIKKKVVKCIGDPEKRFNEDPVRMLRALKLAGQYGFRLNADIKKALTRNMEKIKLASPARLFEEFLKILMSAKSVQILTALQEHGFLQHFWNTLSQSWDETEGLWLRQILETRCNSLKTDPSFPHSKALALSTVCFPFLLSVLTPGESPRLWDKMPALDIKTQKVIQLVFSDFAVPKLFLARMQIIMHMVPKLFAKNIPLRTLRNIEYHNGLALAETAGTAFCWDITQLIKLHNAGYATERPVMPPPPLVRPKPEESPNQDAAPADVPTKRRRKCRHSRKNKKAPSAE